MVVTKYKIIISSDELWCDVLHTPLQYAMELSKSYKIYYVNPPVKWKLSNLINFKIKTKEISDSILVIDYLNIFPVIFFKKLFVMMNDFINFFLISKIVGSKQSDILFWKFDCFRMAYHFFIKPSYIIYHVIDNYMKQPLNLQLTKTANLVITTHDRLVNPYKLINKNVIHIPQGVREAELVPDHDKVNCIKNELGNFILFIGTISPDIDLNLLNDIVKKFTEYHLVIIGPKKNISGELLTKFNQLCKLENVSYVGILNGADLKNYVAASSVCLIPYDFNQQASQVIRSPLKVINYIAQSKPVITTYDCEIPELKDKIIYQAENPQMFIQLVGEALKGELLVDDTGVKKYLDRIIYNNLIENIFSSLIKTKNNAG